MYKVGDKFWRVDVTEGKVETEFVTVTKVTKQYYYIEPSELMFHCSVRLKILDYCGKEEVVHHTTKKAALMEALRWEKFKIAEARKDSKALKKELEIW